MQKSLEVIGYTEDKCKINRMEVAHLGLLVVYELLSIHQVTLMEFEL